MDICLLVYWFYEYVSACWLHDVKVKNAIWFLVCLFYLNVKLVTGCIFFLPSSENWSEVVREELSWLMCWRWHRVTYETVDAGLALTCQAMLFRWLLGLILFWVRKRESHLAIFRAIWSHEAITKHCFWDDSSTSWEHSTSKGGSEGIPIWAYLSFVLHKNYERIHNQGVAIFDDYDTKTGFKDPDLI